MEASLTDQIMDRPVIEGCIVGRAPRLCRENPVVEEMKVRGMNTQARVCSPAR